MEAAQDTFLEAAIGWLVQTILESLSTGKLEAWIRGVGLADDVERFKSEIERVEMVVAAVKGRAIGNKLLARSLARLKELLYDADDAVDEQDYYRLQQQVERALVYPESADGHGAEQVERPRDNADIPSKFLLILDDVWDNMDDYRWNRLLAPLKSSRAKGNVILVTTRILSVAQRICTVEPIKLGALADEDFWLLFKACAFGDENYDGHVDLSTIGRQIADRLQGNPLAAETAGALLREHLTIDHWSNILKNEDWKSLQLSRGIMPALKFSYDQLPYHLQRCFSYCSIFPNKYQFLSEELIHVWISQGYVNGGYSSKRLEEMGQDYLFDLVNSGFFQQDERKRSSLGDQTCYVMCGLMHDFAMVVSRTECATIDGLQCNEMLPTVRHLSIVTDSAYTEDRHGNKLRNEKFEKKMLDVVTSVRKLRTLVLIGQYDPSFLQQCQNFFKEAQKLRVLQISTKCAGFNSFLCNVANPSHLRYLKLEAGEEDGVLPQVLSKFYHLQVLVVGSDTKLTISNGVNNLVSLRHLVAEEDVYSSIANIGKMTSLQELHNFSVRNSSGFEITQLQSMNKLVQLGVSQLENVKTREEAYEAGLINKQHLGKLHLSWKMPSHRMNMTMTCPLNIL